MTDLERLRPAHREQLIYLLTEAAELEHGLMCSYLFAAFSLRRAADDLDEPEVAAIERFRASIREVAIEEMLHLVVVQNLLTAVGGAPHLARPNFPVSPGLYPSEFGLRLRRFDEATLEHFTFLERPEGVSLPDGEGFEPARDYVRETSSVVQLMASARDYPSVAALYRGIEDGFEALCGSMGEAALFIGDPAVQVGQELIQLEGLHPVTDLPSAKAAIAQIIEQGEGGRGVGSTSHYERFCAMRDEYEALRKRRSGFEAAHPVAADPVMHRPIDAESRAYVSHPEAARVLDLGNAAYGLMVQLLARFFSAVDDHASRGALIDAAIALMSQAIGPVAELLATLPIGPSRDGENAGLTFTLPRSTHALPQRDAAWTLLHERATQIATACMSGEDLGVLHAVGQRVSAIADRLEQHRALREGSRAGRHEPPASLPAGGSGSDQR